MKARQWNIFLIFIYIFPKSGKACLPWVLLRKMVATSNFQGSEYKDSKKR